jgi:hypothetical protein
MNYTSLDKNYKYETIATAIYAREVEYFHYDFDRVNFEYLIANSTDKDFVADITNRLADTQKQMLNLINIVAALNSQIDDEAAYLAAVERVTTKRKSEQ